MSILPSYLGYFLSKTQVYNKIQEFLSQTYCDANEVLQVEDKEDGLLIGKGNTVFFVNDIFAGSAIKQTVWHVFKAEIKDNKVRITISINTVNWNSEATKAGGIYISAKDGEYPIISCYPISKDDSRKKRSGYVFFYAVNDIVSLLESCEVYLTKKQDLTTDDNW